jgi:hypothetical protein
MQMAKEVLRLFSLMLTGLAHSDHKTATTAAVICFVAINWNYHGLVSWKFIFRIISVEMAL